MDSNCSSCNNTFMAEDATQTMCADCSSNDRKDAQSTQYESPVVVSHQPNIQNDRAYCSSFGELEQELFADSEGSKTVARVLTRMRLEGYEEEAWKVVMGLTAFAYKNFNCRGYSVEQMRKEINNAPLREITEYIPGNIEELTQQIQTSDVVMMGSENKKGSKNMNDLYTMGGLVALTLAFAFVSRRK